MVRWCDSRTISGKSEADPPCEKNHLLLPALKFSYFSESSGDFLVLKLTGLGIMNQVNYPQTCRPGSRSCTYSADFQPPMKHQSSGNHC